MNSREVLEQLLKENPKAKERLYEILQMSGAEAKEAFAEFQEEYGLALKAEDFDKESIGEEKLAQVAGGADPVSLIGLGIGIYGLFDQDQTGRGTKSGSKRYA